MKLKRSLIKTGLVIIVFTLMYTPLFILNGTSKAAANCQDECINATKVVYNKCVHDCSTLPGSNHAICEANCKVKYPTKDDCNIDICKSVKSGGDSCNWDASKEQCILAAAVVDPDKKVKNNCPDPDKQIDTALGCVVATPVGVTNFMLRFFIAIGLGIAVIKGGLDIWKWRNSDSPDKKQEASKDLMMVFTGLVLLFLAIPLLKFIGIDVLGLDQFGGGVLKDILP